MVPWDRAVTTKIAFEPLGEHPAPAIVCCVLYFLASCGAAFSLAWTKYSWYDVLLISTLFRTVAYGVKAAMLVSYWPALGGVYLAFLNAGFGANTAAGGFLIFTWVSANGLHFYGDEQRYLLKWLSLLIIVSVLMFGPVVGVVAAALEYGAYTRYVATYGERMRQAASYGLVSVAALQMALSGYLCITVFITQRSKAGRRPATATQPERDPRFVGLIFICACLLAVRGAVGVVGAYSDYMQYGKWWLKDKYFYSADTLPELVVLCIELYPFNYARMGQAWPRALGQKDEEQSEGSQQPNRHSACEPNGHLASEQPNGHSPSGEQRKELELQSQQQQQN